MDKTKYTPYDDLTSVLRAFEAKFPTIAKLHAVGTSVQNRTLWALQITDQVTNEEPGEPMFKYVANMHGNEPVGRQILLYLIEYLLTNYNSDDRITKLVNSTNIYIMPSMNPDGFELAKEGDCDGLVGRGNANNIDLNRNFPDQFPKGDQESQDPMQPEVQAMMAWITQNKFVLSANLHGGSVVASYPFDDSENHKRHFYSASPDDAQFINLSHVYANNHKTMQNGQVCKGDDFTGGITNGAQWYDIAGKGTV